MKTTLHLVMVAVVWIVPQPAAAEELKLTAKALIDKAITRDVRLNAAGTAIELDDGELFEDDGPAAGYSYKPNEERLSDRVWVKKELLIPNPGARKATLLVGPGGDLKTLINGKVVALERPAKAGNYWQAYSIPPDSLKAGKNEIVLHGSGKVWIARAEDFASGSTERTTHPNRSARSADAGKSWEYDRLGPSGEIDGEYYVRLFLDHYRSTGSLILPVLDASNLNGSILAPPLAAPIPVTVHLDVDTGTAGRVRLRIRSGTTAAPDTMNWSDWEDLDAAKSTLRKPRGRFVQVALILSTTDPLHSPQIKSLRVETSPKKGENWAEKLKIIDVHNEEIVRTSIPFAYEPFGQPRLKELRTRHKLDEIVKGAKTELELIERLARWSSGLWERGHLKEGYPAWDALEILKSHADGKPVGGFCQQYNVVFLQACASYGIPGRAVSISTGDHGEKVRGGGHEVIEVWSNEFKKWIYVDGNMAWYAVDPESKTPLSLWELRLRQLPLLKGKAPATIRVIALKEGGKRWESLASWPPFLELRLLPRSNFLEKKSPLPLNQGMRGWFWTGHYAWTDANCPASLLYGHRVAQRRNWQWTLNQAHFTLEATATPGEVRVHLDTETPGFETFLAEIDGAAPKPVASSFIWKLHSGKNRLEVRPRNTTGRNGIASWVVVE